MSGSHLISQSTVLDSTEGYSGRNQDQEKAVIHGTVVDIEVDPKRVKDVSRLTKRLSRLTANSDAIPQ